MSSQDDKRMTRNLIIFVVMVLGLATTAGVIETITVSPDAEPDAAGLGQLLWLISPLAVVLILRSFGGDGWDDVGLRPNFKNNGLWWVVSILIFPVVIAISTLAGAALGIIDINSNVLPIFGTGLMAVLASSLVKTFFEEMAWRGYLAPKVYSLKLNMWLSHAIVGIVWGAWHLPFISVFWTYVTPEMLWYFIPLLLLGTTSQSVVYGEIRLATGSALPAWVMHTIGSVIGNTILLSGLIRLVSGKELWFSPGVESVSSILLMFILGYWLHRRREKKKDST